jgi:hypothetical protein
MIQSSPIPEAIFHKGGSQRRDCRPVLNAEDMIDSGHQVGIEGVRYSGILNLSVHEDITGYRRVKNALSFPPVVL